MRMRVLKTKLRVEIENEMRVFLESLNFEIEMRVSQKSALLCLQQREYALVKFFLQAQNIRHLYFQSDRNTKAPRVTAMVA